MTEQAFKKIEEGLREILDMVLDDKPIGIGAVRAALPYMTKLQPQRRTEPKLGEKK